MCVCVRVIGVLNHKTLILGTRFYWFFFLLFFRPKCVRREKKNHTREEYIPDLCVHIHTHIYIKAFTRVKNRKYATERDRKKNLYRSGGGDRNNAKPADVSFCFIFFLDYIMYVI